MQIWNLKIRHHWDFLWKELSKWKFYEEDYLKFSITQLSKWSVILDVWANIGNHTIYWSYKWYKVIAFEPMKENFKLLLQNIFINNLWDNVEAYNFWLWEKEETVEFQVVQNNMWACRKWKWEKVKIRILDDYNFWKIDLIKIDVEWMELEVLKGWIETIIGYKPDLMVEINNIETLKFIEELWYKKVMWKRTNKNMYFKYFT